MKISQQPTTLTRNLYVLQQAHLRKQSSPGSLSNRLARLKFPETCRGTMPCHERRIHSGPAQDQPVSGEGA